MDALFAHVREAAKTADEAQRKKIIDDLRDLSIELESPWDSMQRIMYLVGIPAHPLDLIHVAA
jgi:hypothetical protein